MRFRFAALALTMLLAARPAYADEPYAPAAYGAVALEYGMFGVFYANFNDVWSSKGPALALNFTPMVLGAGAAIGAHYGDFNPRPAHAIHGAGWFGVEGFLIGALIDGRDKGWGLRAGRWAWTLGAIGAVSCTIHLQRDVVGIGIAVQAAGPNHEPPQRSIAWGRRASQARGGASLAWNPSPVTRRPTRRASAGRRTSS